MTQDGDAEHPTALSVLLSNSSAEGLHDLLSQVADPARKMSILQVIGERLTQEPDYIRGSYDDFHNLVMECFRATTYDVALAVLECGLRQCPDNPTLVGDRIQALRSSGKALDAIEAALGFWLRTEPHKFASDWRVAVFFKSSVEQLDPAFSSPIPATILEQVRPRVGNEPPSKWGELAEMMMRKVLEFSPGHVKIWNELSEVLDAMGEWKRARDLLCHGIAANPGSQQLRYAYATLLLENLRGASEDAEIEKTVDDAIDSLRRASAADYQHQFQPDVSQEAVLLRLAQAWEAKARIGTNTDGSADLARARSLYELIVRQGEADKDKKETTLVRYAKGRMMCIDAYAGLSG